MLLDEEEERAKGTALERRDAASIEGASVARRGSNRVRRGCNVDGRQNQRRYANPSPLHSSWCCFMVHRRFAGIVTRPLT